MANYYIYYKRDPSSLCFLGLEQFTRMIIPLKPCIDHQPLWPFYKMMNWRDGSLRMDKCTISLSYLISPRERYFSFTLLSSAKTKIFFHQFQRASNTLSIMAKRLLAVVHKFSRYTLLSNFFPAYIYIDHSLQPHTTNTKEKTPSIYFLPQITISPLSTKP